MTLLYTLLFSLWSRFSPQFVSRGLCWTSVQAKNKEHRVAARVTVTLTCGWWCAFVQVWAWDVSDWSTACGSALQLCLCEAAAVATRGLSTVTGTMSYSEVHSACCKVAVLSISAFSLRLHHQFFSHSFPHLSSRRLHNIQLYLLQLRILIFPTRQRANQERRGAALADLSNPCVCTVLLTQ